MSTVLKEAQKKQVLQNLGWGGVFDVTSDITRGALGLYTMTYAAGTEGAEPHFHKKMIEIFNVLEGAMSVLINGEWRVVEAGGTVIIPTMTIHGFKPLEDRSCKIQILFTPNMKREEFFLDFHLYSNATDKEKYEFWAKYDQYPPQSHPDYKGE
ncbi:MAG TPA: cupin domain-containing protein [Bdellovibrio sp.]|uniref:cupin domain-containing protein n=1 Tax=Bdellovibrio sp. TaxID=28201 RepID=UPI002EECC5B2